MADGNQMAETKTEASGTTGRPLVIVAGMHRSGTSAITRMVNLTGFAIADDLMAAAEDNERGFWESESLAAYHDRFFEAVDYSYDCARQLPADALTGTAAERLHDRIVDHLQSLPQEGGVIVKDPRISLVLPIWLRAADMLGMAPKLIIAVRNPLEVAASLDRRNRFSYQKSLLLWLRYLVSVERNSREVDRVSVNYSDLLKDWRVQAKRIFDKLGLGEYADTETHGAEIDEFLSPELRHHDFDDHAVFEDPRTTTWVRDVFQELRRTGRDEPDRLVQTVDAVAMHLDATGDILEQLIAQQDNLIYELAQERDGIERELDDAREAVDREQALRVSGEADAATKQALAEEQRAEIEKLQRKLLEEQENSKAANAEVRAEELDKMLEKRMSVFQKREERMQRELEEARLLNERREQEVKDLAVRLAVADQALSNREVDIARQRDALEAAKSDMAEQADQAEIVALGHRERIVELEERLARIVAENSELVGATEQERRQVADVQKELEQARNEIDRLRSDGEALEKLVDERLVPLVAVDDDFRGRAHELEVELSTAERRREEVAKQLELERSSTSDLKRQVQQAQARVREVEELRDEAVDRLQGDLESAREELRRQGDQQRQAVGIAEGEIASLRTALSHAERQLAVAEVRVEYLDSERQDVSERVLQLTSDLSAARDEARRAGDELHNAQLNLSEQVKETAHLREERDRLREQLDGLGDLRDTAAELRLELGLAVSERDRLTAEATELQKQIKALAPLQVKVETKQAELVKLRAERTTLKKADQKQQRRIGALESDLEKLKSRLDAAVSERDGALAQNRDIEARRSEVEAALNAAHEERSALNAQADEMAAALERLEADLNVAQAAADDAVTREQMRISALEADLEAARGATATAVSQAVDEALNGAPADGSEASGEAPIVASLDPVSGAELEALQDRNDWLMDRLKSARPVASDLSRRMMDAGVVGRTAALMLGLYAPVRSRNPLRASKLAVAAEQIRASGAFDEEFYLARNWDVAVANEDPVIHYLTSGAQEGRDPSADFSSAGYLEANPDVARSGVNPLLHFIRIGREEGRISRPTIAQSQEYDPLHSADGDPYALRPDDCVIPEVKAGEAFMERFDLLGETPDFAGAVASLNDDSRVAACINANSDQDPVVSIVVPVYGQLPYTLNCLDSLRRHESRFRFEVVVYDDRSPDTVTGEFLPQVDWINYVLADENRGFIHACNAGASVSRGQYFVMLNNDTRVVPGWLDEMIGTFEHFPRAGLVGSKLFYPDGSLQEAGGIVWQDGSAWNYGRNDDPNRPEYCHARQADYISGAAIALTSDLWHALRGFDGETYERAYYEDTDMAFRVRESGWQTWMQPQSRVIHYEGKTSGTDEGAGEKAYQASNRVRFYERWKHVLAGHRPNAERPWREAQRGSQKLALIIDATTPTPDKDSGSLDVVNLFHMLQEMGYASVFVPEDNHLFFGDYTRELQRTGVQCLYHPFSLPFEPFLEKFGAEFDTVILHRMDTTSKWFDKIRDYCPDAKIIFNTVDLHHIRERREGDLKNDPELISRSERSEKIELDLIRRADHSIVVSSYERDALLKREPDLRVSHLPLIRAVPGSEASFAARRGLVFVGGFAHAPNLDAVKYFVENVWPGVRERLPDAVFRIVGSKMPDEVFNLGGSNGIEAVGFVQELSDVLDASRLMVAPLRFGAGAKGKVISSLSHGLPCIATPVAAEGMTADERDGIVVRDGAAELCEAIVRLYDDAEAWGRASEGAIAFSKRNNSFDRGIDVLRNEVGL